MTVLMVNTPAMGQFYQPQGAPSALGIVRPAPQIETSERYVQIRREAELFIAALRRYTPYSAEARQATSRFQTAAEVSGDGGQPSGVYGPATRLALEFFTPEGTVLPAVWPNARPGTWRAPAWTRDVVRDVPGPVVRKFPTWQLVLGAVFTIAAGTVIYIGVRESRR